MSNINTSRTYAPANFQSSSKFSLTNTTSNSSMHKILGHRDPHGRQRNPYELKGMWLHDATALPPLRVAHAWGQQLAAITGLDESIVWGLLSLLVLLFLYRVVFRGVFGILFRSRRDLVLLIGLPSSGKTALLARIASGSAPSTQTSLQPNRLEVSVPKGRAHVQRTVVDYPGHRRLRGTLPALLASARKVVVVIDAITIHDDRHEGAHALADLLVSVFQSSEFHGVKGVLFACTKRDELTSYSARAVQKLLETAMARALTSRKGDLDRVDVVVDSKGRSIGKTSRRKNTNHGRMLQVDERGAFVFDQLGVPYRFVEVSSFPDEAIHPFNVQPVLDFIV